MIRKTTLFELLDELDSTGERRASYTRILMMVLLRTLEDYDDRRQVLDFLMKEYAT